MNEATNFSAGGSTWVMRATEKVNYEWTAVGDIKDDWQIFLGLPGIYLGDLRTLTSIIWTDIYFNTSPTKKETRNDTNEWKLSFLLILSYL